MWFEAFSFPFLPRDGFPFPWREKEKERERESNNLIRLTYHCVGIQSTQSYVKRKREIVSKNENTLESTREIFLKERERDEVEKERG